ncbi:hypothetical protein BDW59DRAFT_182155 [Aspergillus cavernicola]|uniref:Permease for cytosine/purines, uracil, thiamine, allantoin-domain-containing protein n=1 Tax=Aspergillus cavernicola TaxID=176166 RepID=A0ABR4IUQ5_9EURO
MSPFSFDEIDQDSTKAMDVEKSSVPHDKLSGIESGVTTEISEAQSPLQRWARGIDRVPEELRQPNISLRDYCQMGLVWFSSNCTAGSITIGILGPILFGVGLNDALVLSVFASMLAALAVGYISTFGPASGNRTMVFIRYTMGWWPSRICVLLNLVIMLGWGLVDVLVAGQILTAINGGGMSVIVGVVVASLLSLLVVIFGIRAFHTFERYAWVPQLMVMFILIGLAGPSFDTRLITTGSSSQVKNADRMSFFFLAFSGPITWAPAGADFYVYFSPNATRWKVWLSATLGLGIGTAIATMLGAGIGSGISANPSWTDAYNQSNGALLVEIFRPLNHFGSFCNVILALGLIANNVAGTYSAALSFQLLGRWFAKVPRLIWTVVSVIIYTVLACVGRNDFYDVFENFLALMGYWVAIWVTITLEEEFIFRRKSGYDWTAWNNPKLLPIGLAALAAFVIGWGGSILGMYQTYFTGPVGKLVGDGIDLGVPLGVSWGGLAYLPLRWLELKYVGR